MYSPPKQYRHGKGGTMICIMEYLGNPRGSDAVLSRCYQYLAIIQNDIYYSGKYNRNNMGRPCVI